MEDSKAVKFFDEVLSKTKDGKIRWQPTATDCDFIAAVGGHFTLSISEYMSEGFPNYVLVLKDQEGRVLTRVTNGDRRITYQSIAELYETARRQALRVDDKIDQILGELSKL